MKKESQSLFISLRKTNQMRKMLNKETGLSIFSCLAFSTLICSLLQTPSCAAKQAYIVYLGSNSRFPGNSAFHDEKVTQSHYDVLSSVVPSQSQDAVRSQLLYSYTECMNGFAAILDDAQVKQLQSRSDVKAIFQNKKYKLHTTHSWDFLGLEGNDSAPAGGSVWGEAKYGQDVIIANLDTGVWPESRSFNDEGMGPVPARWGGSCQPDGGVRCNRKLIGAKFFSKGAETGNEPINKTMLSARDFEGHGSHTLSTAGGSFVPGANIFGYGNGTSKGGSPKARVAAYKVCWNEACYGADILAGFDAAIRDGVDVISVSLGTVPTDLYADATAIGSFHAIQKGIPVIASAGNEGPTPQTVNNVAPWVFTIGASTMDRDFINYVVLGDQRRIKGTSLSDKTLPAGKSYPLISSIDAKAANSASDADARECAAGSLDRTKVIGTIVVCLRGNLDRLEKGATVASLGGVGMVLANNQETGNEILADPHFLPATHVTYADGLALLNYINSTKNPTATITPITTEVGIKPAPVMAAFSSRGPSSLVPGLLKPDVTAPGVNVLAAYSEAVSPSLGQNDKRRVPFIVMSGTSMSCPHVSGIVGLIKSIHPDWSPAAIKSAIMTTAETRGNNGKSMLDADGKPATPFGYGAGHVRPNLAADPGLVYDLTTIDFLNSLCALGYNRSIIRELTDEAFTCPKNFTLNDFNYPSIVVPNLNGPVVVTRKLKNVGNPGTYTVRVEAPAQVSVAVEPTQLAFTKIGDEMVYKVILKPTVNGGPKNYVFGSLTWSDGKHIVKSPLVVKHA